MHEGGGAAPEQDAYSSLAGGGVAELPAPAAKQADEPLRQPMLSGGGGRGEDGGEGVLGRQRRMDHPLCGVIVGVLSGVLGGALNEAGPPVVIYLVLKQA